MDAEAHYDRTYFARRQNTFEFGGWANVTKFERHIRPEHTVLDFGCSGGYLLDNVKCRRKVGVELNAVPREIALGKGFEVYERTASVRDESIDVVISNHVLEHTTNPLAELRTLRSKLKSGGRLVICVPHEQLSIKYRPANDDFHLYTWSPMNLGNLLTAAGLEVLECKAYRRRWPPRVATQIANLFGRRTFDAACIAYGALGRGASQVLAVAKK